MTGKCTDKNTDSTEVYYRAYIFVSKFINVYRLERVTRPMLTPHDARRQFNLSGIRTCDQLHASPELRLRSPSHTRLLILFNIFSVINNHIFTVRFVTYTLDT